MYRTPTALLNDDFRQAIREDIDFQQITHKSTLKKQRKLTDAMTQLMINTCDKFQRHKDFPLWNAVRLSRAFQKDRFPRDFKPFQNVLEQNGCILNHFYRPPTAHHSGTTKAVIIPHRKIKQAVDYLETINQEQVQLNDELLIDWSNPYLFNDVPVPNKVRINAKALQQFSSSVQSTSGHLHKKWNLQLRMNTALDCDGWLEQDYRTSTFGRLVGTGLSSLQTMPKILLKEVLAGTFEIDVNACSYSLLPAIYNQTLIKDFRFPAVERYARNRSIIREEVFRSIGSDLETIKTGFAAIAFGVRSNVKGYYNVDDVWQLPTLTEIFGSSSLAQAFINHPEVKSVWTELKKIFSVLAECSRSQLPHLKPSQRVAFLYQHQEARLLRAMMRNVGRSLVLPKHDAVIINAPLSIQQLKQLETVIYQELGSRVSLSQEAL